MTSYCKNFVADSGKHWWYDCEEVDSELTQLCEALARAEGERDKLAARLKAVEARARPTFELRTMQVLLDENAGNGTQRLSQIIVAWDEADRRVRAAEQERDTLKAERERLGQEIHSLRIGNQDAQAVISRQAGMLTDLRTQLTTSREEGYRAGMERAAEMLENRAGYGDTLMSTELKLQAAAIRAESSTLPRTYEQGAEDWMDGCGKCAPDGCCTHVEPTSCIYSGTSVGGNYICIRALPTHPPRNAESEIGNGGAVDDDGDMSA